jgi:hypothetical protein
MKNLIFAFLMLIYLSSYGQIWESVIPNSINFQNSIGSQLGGWHDQGSLTLFKDQLYISGSFDEGHEKGTLIFDGRYTSIFQNSPNPISNYSGQTVHLTSTDSLILLSNLSRETEKISLSALENAATLAFDSEGWQLRFTNRQIKGEYYYRVQNTLQIQGTTYTLARKDTLINNEEVAIWDILAISPTDTNILPIKALVNSPFGMFNIGDELYINQLNRPELPNYQYVNGISLPRLSKWDGEKWLQCGLTEVSNTAQSVISHDGNLIAAGLPYDNSGLSSVQQLVNNHWVNIGNNAFDEGVNSIYSYRNILFALVGGSKLYRYNDISWSKVNDQILYDQNENPGGGKQIIGFKDDLFVAGNFTRIDSIPISGLARIPILISGNIAPVALADEVTINDGEEIEIIALLNDSDENPDYLRLNILSYPTLGQIEITPQETFYYSAQPFKTGDDFFEYSVCDRSGGCDTARIQINILEKNALPIANDEHFLNNEKGHFEFNPLQNDSDPENEGLRFQFVTYPINGQLILLENFDMEYHPDITQPYQTDEFYYSVCDSFNDCDTARATFNTRLKYLPPIANKDSYAPFDQNPYVYNLSENDEIREFYPQSFTIETEPAHGKLIAFPTDSFIVVYSPEDPTANYDYFTYKVCDSVGNCSMAKVEFTLIPEKTTGVLEVKRDFKIYPNPARGFAKISNSNAEFDEILITNRIGGLAYRLVDEGKADWEIHPNLRAGVYFITILNNGNVLCREKLVWMN